MAIRNTVLVLAAKHPSKVMFSLGCRSRPATCLWRYRPHILNIWLLEQLSWFLGVLGKSDQPACGHVTEAVATGCIGSNLDCTSAHDICPHICLTVDDKGTDPRRTSPLTTTTYFPVMQRLSRDCVNGWLKMDSISLIWLSLINKEAHLKPRVLHTQWL